MEHSSSSASEPPVEKFLHISYNERWEYLKDDIVRLYTIENKTMKNLQEAMRDRYSFDAGPEDYRYRLRKWGIKKNIVAKQKDAAIVAVHKRRLPPASSTPSVTINQGNFEKTVSNKKIKRHIDDTRRKSENLPTWTPGLFLQYDPSFATLFRKHSGNNNPSPFSIGPNTPSDMHVGSPQEGISPPAPHNTMSSIHRITRLNNARLFLEGREKDLLAQLNSDERRSTATWLQDFWMYSFMTAKYWGRGPLTWTSALIEARTFAGHPIPSTPDHRINIETTSESLSPMAIALSFPNPTQLCRWSIHYRVPEYEYLPSPPPQSLDQPEDIDDESTWTLWDSNKLSGGLASTIGRGLRQNEFSTVSRENIPLDVGYIAKTIENSPEDLAAEALTFAIMSRNIDAVVHILNTSSIQKNIFPFHLAAMFLDGGKTCCSVFQTLLRKMKHWMSIGLNYIDHSGLTVLDALFVTIIRSHSAVPPQALGKAFNLQTRYPGQDVDPCGRWDADSPCVRHLHASGTSSIPNQWKHMFCHTSVQAVCHIIANMFVSWRPEGNTPSGLFVKRCSRCEFEFKVGPLHALVLTAFCLANKGMPGENLFGIIACLVCLLTFRVDPCVVAKISVSLLLGRDPEHNCQHLEIDPTELALILFQEKSMEWTPNINLGWRVMVAILQQDVSKRRINPTQHDEQHNWEHRAETCGHFLHEVEGNIGAELIYCENKRLGMVWAFVQAEFLTYRRLNEEGSWLSSRFDMERLLRGLESDNDHYLERLVGDIGDNREDLLEYYSCCGFFDTNNLAYATREEACVSYYANMDDWKRTTFIEETD
ncbi:hypothetical protein F4805DRAFT_438748 [Annulohypoxylon moriforme]|nr:hypothetical protein F4805DRAFT_438748 [Annulohypoxylon moriforme]